MSWKVIIKQRMFSCGVPLISYMRGHLKLFQEVSKLGNLYVIVLPDKRTSENKRIIHDENERKENLLKTGHVKDAFIDALPDLKCLDLVPPDIFCFGYD